jgi:hypothetical protein
MKIRREIDKWMQNLAPEVVCLPSSYLRRTDVARTPQRGHHYHSKNDGGLLSSSQALLSSQQPSHAFRLAM